MIADSPNPEAPVKIGIRERNKLERRARIVSAARSVFAEKGFAVTASDVSAGVDERARVEAKRRGVEIDQELVEGAIVRPVEQMNARRATVATGPAGLLVERYKRTHRFVTVDAWC